MIDMICDNCGANIDKSEEYCPNCGMQLLDLPPAPMKKKKYYKDSESISPDNSRIVEKPIKRRYTGDSVPESPDYSHYDSRYDEEYGEAESHQQDHYEKDYNEKSGVGIGNIILLLFIALVLGFIVGLLMFGSQSIPQIPGVNI
jgi:hypothetical protein